MCRGCHSGNSHCVSPLPPILEQSTMPASTMKDSSKQRKHAFLKRSLAQRTASSVESEVETTLESSPFLQTPPVRDVVSLHPDEIQLGDTTEIDGISSKPIRDFRMLINDERGLDEIPGMYKYRMENGNAPTSKFPTLCKHHGRINSSHNFWWTCWHLMFLSANFWHGRLDCCLS